VERQTARLPLGNVSPNDLPVFLKEALDDPVHAPDATEVVEQIRRETGFRALLDLLQEGVWVIDAECRTVYVNDRMAGILGTTREDMERSSLLDFTDDDGRTMAEAVMGRRETGVTQEREFRLIRRDGTEVWTHLSAAPVVDTDGTDGGAVMTVLDTNEPPRPDGRRPTGSELFRASFEKVGAAMAIVSRDGRLLEVNRSLCDLLGYEAGQLSGRPFASLGRAVDRPHGSAVITLTDPPAVRGLHRTGPARPDRSAAARSGTPDGSAGREVVTPPEAGERLFVTADGRELWVAVDSAAVHDRDGRVAFFVAHIGDITPRVQREEEVRLQRERSEALARLSQTFAGFVGRDPDEVLDDIVVEVTAAAGDFAVILLGDEPATEVAARAVHHRHPTKHEALARLIGAEPIRRGEGLVGTVYATGDGLVFRGDDIGGFRARIRADLVHLVDDLDVNTIVYLPLITRGRTTGVLIVGGRSGSGGYGDDDVAFLRDVADRVALAIDNSTLYGALRASEERYRLVLDHAPTGIVLSDMQGRILQVNPMVATILQRTEEELVGARFTIATAPEDVAEDREDVRRLLTREAAVVHREKRLMQADGTPVWVWRSLSIIRDEHDEPLHLVGQIIDVTERRRSQHLVDAVFASAPDLLCIVDRKGCFVTVSPSWSELLGWDPAELVGQSVLAHVHPDDVAVTAPLLTGAHPGGVGAEIRYRTRRGDWRWLQWRWTTLPEEGVGVASGRDITDQRRQADELRRSNEDLAQFAAIAAHDLKSPLGIIAGFAQLLRLQPVVQGDEDAFEYAGHIEAASETMRALIDDLLDYCRIGTEGTAHQPVELGAVAQEVLDTLGFDLGRRGAVVEVGPLPRVLGDHGQLRHLMQNLVSNAAKFVVEGVAPRISVRAEATADGWTVEVADNGIGIDPDEHERAFAMFQRLSAASSFDGTGVGLAICRRVVEGHGGTIWIEGNEPRGTRVRFTLPAAGSDPDPDTGPDGDV
jgi:PAS domain S-box-containing protein